MAETKKEPEKILFSKEQIVSSMRYKKYRDFLVGNLDNDKNYSTEEIDALSASRAGPQPKDIV